MHAHIQYSLEHTQRLIPMLTGMHSLYTIATCLKRIKSCTI